MVTDSVQHPGLLGRSVDRRYVVVAVALLCALSAAAGWNLAERVNQAGDAAVTGTITLLSGDSSKVCMDVDSHQECGVLVVPPGTQAPATGQTVQVFLRHVDGVEFLILPSTFG